MNKFRVFGQYLSRTLLPKWWVMLRPWGPPLIIIAAVLCVYAPTIGHEFVYDDVPGILDNTLVSQFTVSRTWEVLSQPWRPLTQISYALTFLFAGFDPRWFHGINIVIHAINSVLVYWIAIHLGRLWLEQGTVQAFALTAGLLHAVHPLYTESVAYVWGRSSSLCALFYFAALLAVIKGEHSRDKTRYLFFGLAILSGYLAWKTKEEAITLPLIVAGFFWLVGRRRVALGLAVIPLLIVVARYAHIETLYAEVGKNEQLVSVGLEPALDSFTYLLTHVKSIVFYYFMRLAAPLDLSVDPDIQPVHVWTDLSFALAVIILACMALLVKVCRDRDRMVSFGTMALLLSPLAAYTLMPLADVTAEHRAYITGLGFDLIAAWLLIKIVRHRNIAIVGIVLLLAILTIDRNTVWANSVTLWEDAEKKAPQRVRPHLNLGEAYHRAGSLNPALEEYAHAAALNPDLTAVYVNVGAIRLTRNELDLAEEALKRAADLSPEIPETYVNLALIELRRNRVSAAQERVEQALRLAPKSYLVRFTRGEVLLAMGRTAEAVEEYQAAIQLRPDLAILREQYSRRLARIAAERER